MIEREQVLNKFITYPNMLKLFNKNKFIKLLISNKLFG